MVLPLCFQGAGSGLKTQAQFVHGAQQPVALALIMIGPVQTPLHQAHYGVGDGLGREGQGLLPHHAKPGALGIQAMDLVQQHIGGKAAGANAEAGETGGMGHSPAAGIAEEGAEAGGGIDGAAPLMGEFKPLQLGEGGKEVAGQPLEGGGAGVEKGIRDTHLGLLYIKTVSTLCTG